MAMTTTTTTLLGFRITVLVREGREKRGREGSLNSRWAWVTLVVADSQSLNKTFMAFALIDGAQFAVQ